MIRIGQGEVMGATTRMRLLGVVRRLVAVLGDGMVRVVVGACRVDQGEWADYLAGRGRGSRREWLQGDVCGDAEDRK